MGNTDISKLNFGSKLYSDNLSTYLKENILCNSFINRNISVRVFKDNQCCKFQIVILVNSYSKTLLLSSKM